MRATAVAGDSRHGRLQRRCRARAHGPAPDVRRRRRPGRADFSVPPGTLFGFVGRNGAGKTTTMRIVCGLLAADEGRVTWRGEPIDVRARADRLHAGGARAVSEDARRATNSSTSACCTASRTSRRARRPTDGWSGSGWATARLARRAALAGQPAAGTARGGARASAGPARARRAVRRARSDRLRPADGCCASRRRAACRCCSPRISSSWSSTSARRWRSSTGPGGRLRRGGRAAGRRPRMIRARRADATGTGPRARRGARSSSARPTAWCSSRPGGRFAAVLDAARRAGTVVRFAEERPTLAELFRDLVAA